MRIFCLLNTLALAAGSSLAATDLAPLSSNVEVRNGPGLSSTDTLRLLHRSISAEALKRETDPVSYKGNTTLDTSWDGAVLFTMAAGIQNQSGNKSASAGVAIVCNTCYIKGLATAEFTIQQGFNISQAVRNITSEIGDAFQNFSTAVADYVDKYVDQVVNVTSKIFTSEDVDLDDYNFPPIDIDFDIEVPEIPECELQFQFDGLELYMEIDTILSLGATYIINLYTSRTPIGFAVGKDLLIGVVFTVDLILDVQAEIDIRSGFHIRLDDGIAINIPIFSNNVSSITFNGGNFEFLPVTIKSAGVVLTAVLRIGVKAGIELATPKAINNMPALKAAQVEVSTGIVAGVWVDIAQFKTNITAAPATNGNTCELRVIEDYVLALGAGVGATLTIGDHEWGPELDIKVPIFYTTLVDVCAVSKTKDTTSTSAIKGRQILSTKTTVTEVTYTAIQCLSTGLVNCPASLQTTLTNKVETTMTATLTSSGAKAVFTTKNTAVSTIAFGGSAHKMSATSGTPVSFVPPKPTSTSKVGSGNGDDSIGSDFKGVLNSQTGGVSNKIIIGVSVGVGGPVLIAIIAGIVYLCKRKRRVSTKSARGSAHHYQPAHQGPEPYVPGPYMTSKKGAAVNVVEYRPRS